MALALCTTIVRDDGLVRDVTLSFTALCTLKATRACWDDPGFPAEYECELVEAALDCPDSADDTLTEVELATLRAWFAQHHDLAETAANDHDAGATP